jgi:PAS domain S-box-containing protein
MNTEQQTNAQLHEEIARLRRRVAEVEEKNSRLQQSVALLQESDELLQAIIERTPTVIFIKDVAGRYLLINREYERRNHVARADFLGKTDADLFPPAIAAQLRANDQQVLASGMPLEFEEEVRHVDHPQVYVTMKFPIRDGQGRPYAVAGVSTDITARKQAEDELRRAHNELEMHVQERTVALEEANTVLRSEIAERKRAEEALRAAEQEYRQIFEHIPVGIYRSSIDGKQIRANPALVKLNGYTSEEEMLPSVNDIATEWYVDPRRREEFKEILDRQGYVTSFESEIYRHKSRERIWISENARLVRDAEGNPLYYEGTVQDITERKHAEGERQQLQAQFFQKQKLEALGTLAGGVAHDFNNVLAAIMGYAELVRDEAPVGTMAWRNLEKIIEASQRAKGLVLQVLTFSRPSREVSQGVHIQQSVEETLRFLRASLPKTVQLRPTLRCTNAQVLIDPTQMQQLLTNLCVNAAQAMDGEPGILEIDLVEIDKDEIRTRPNGALSPGVYVQLMVRDSGCGMAPEVMERIFEPFFTTKPVGEGSGMGLAIVHGIVESCRGAIAVQSQRGQGTTFLVYLPVHETEGVRETDVSRGRDLTG